MITLDLHHLSQDSDPESIIYLDTRCGVTFIDKSWLLRHLLEQKLSMMSTPLKVKRIRVSRYKTKKFAALSLYFPGKDGAGKLVYTLLRCKIHLVEGLRRNLLIGNDIISLDHFVIDIKKKTTLIGSCGVTVLISARQKGQFLIKKLLTSELIMVPP